jgi:hypothetical protein
LSSTVSTTRPAKPPIDKVLKLGPYAITQSTFDPPDPVSTLEAEFIAFEQLKKISSDTVSTMTQSVFAPPDPVSTLEAEAMAFEELKKASSDTVSTICSITFRL